MATGLIDKHRPPTNTGKDNGIGQIEETINGIPQGAPYFVFSTPGDNGNIELPIGSSVTFDKTGPGQKVSNVKKAAPAFAIITFAALASSGAGLALTHMLFWETSGALSGKISYTPQATPGVPRDIDITVNVNSGSTIVATADIADTAGYTIIIYDGAGYTGANLKLNAKAA